MNLFREINQQGITMVLVTHDKDVANTTDRIINLKDGVII